ncbi:sigma-54-dependent Fis family transcriptional regulator, partial [bacterium]|nr:sigma-54-dependent Fis family transcriptional regulator [candidate division CSSED10-310 bacterium]
MVKAHILAVDDHLSARHHYFNSLSDVYTVEIASNGIEALKKANDTVYDLYIVDLMMPGMNGIEFIKRLRKIHNDPQVVIVSQTEDLDLAIEAFRQHPVDFLRKPVRKSILRHCVAKNLTVKSMRCHLNALSRESSRDSNCPEPVFGQSSTMKKFWDHVHHISRSNLNISILLTGESGSGKEIVARQIHKISQRCQSPFIAVNCGLLSRELAASELFGIKEGVATGVKMRTGKFQAAHGGTLFLDEIAEIPP